MEGESGKEGENGGKEDSDDFFYVITKLPIKKGKYYRVDPLVSTLKL